MSDRYASYSSLTQHRSCPQKWNYARLRKLEKDDPEDATVELDFGNWWHALRAADSITRGRELDTLKSAPEFLSTSDDGPRIPTDQDALVIKVLQAASETWSRMHPDLKDIWEGKLGSTLPDRLKDLDVAWTTEHAEERRFEEPIAVEVKWERRLPEVTQVTGPEEMGKVDPKMTLIGYIDEIYRDTRRRIIVARDHKSHKTLASQSAVDDMMESQLQLYAWGASPLVASWGLDKIHATAYDRVRSVAPKTPAVTASGGLSKSVSDYDLITYLNWANGPDGEGVLWGKEGEHFASGPRKGQPKWGYYQPEDAVIERLSQPAARSAWFQRTLTPLNVNVLRTHLRAAADTAIDTSLTVQRVEITGAAARNLGGACKWCPFVTLCRAEMMGGADGEYDLAEHKLRPRKARVR